jgi:hypothetical protein
MGIIPTILLLPHKAKARKFNAAASILMRAGIVFVSFLFLLMSANAVTESVAAASTSSEVPADWIEVSAGREFDLRAPAGTEFRPLKGIDSFVGSFAAPDFELSFDYGLYSNPLNDMSGDDAYKTQDVLVDGKTAYIVTAYAPRLSADRPYFIGIHFPKIKMTNMGPTKLTVFGLLETADDYTVVEKIFRTIHFN